MFVVKMQHHEQSEELIVFVETNQYGFIATHINPESAEGGRRISPPA
jgi:hypothetical protein